MYQRFGKRLVDIVLTGVAVVGLSPILLMTSVAIRVEDGGPIIYRQRRIGQNGTAFTILKFRSMPTATKVAPSAGMGSARVTRIGKLIRRLNVDELPQMFNILKGDMAIVGPRPALESQLVLIDKRSQGPAIAARPGLTGLAQVKAFDGMDEATKASYDNQYAANITLWGDAKIIASTVAYLFKPPPVY